MTTAQAAKEQTIPASSPASPRTCGCTPRSRSGRVVAIIDARGEDDAIRIANDTQYGLSAAVLAPDPDTGMRVARRIDSAATSRSPGSPTCGGRPSRRAVATIRSDDRYGAGGGVSVQKPVPVLSRQSRPMSVASSPRTMSRWSPRRSIRSSASAIVASGAIVGRSVRA
jgi:Aldehyde dehydrogenase family